MELLVKKAKRGDAEAFIELIWKFLNAGYMENWEYNATFSGIAQGSGGCGGCYGRDGVKML